MYLYPGQHGIQMLSPGGKLTNNGKMRYSEVTIECSAIETKTGEKLQKSFVAVLRNVYPGDTVRWHTREYLTMKIDKWNPNPCTARIDKITRVVEEK